MIPLGEFAAAFAAFDAEEARIKALVDSGVVVVKPPFECPFEAYDRERREASVRKYIESEHGSLEALDAALEAEFAGQKGRNVEEMMAWLEADEDD